LLFSILSFIGDHSLGDNSGFWPSEVLLCMALKMMSFDVLAPQTYVG